jgi:hypothetical protein
MTRLVRRSLLVLSLLVAVLAVLSAVGVTLFKGTPDFYRPRPAQTAAQRETSAQAAENKIIDARNWAALLRADQTRAAVARQQGSTTIPAARAESSHLIEFSQAELDALMDKWSTLYNWREKYDAYVEDPQVILRDGKLILAARVKDLGAVASFQFAPSVDAQGKLHLDLVRVAGGRLPLPDAVWAHWRDQVVQSLRRQMPQWRQGARIDSAGSANFPAMAATLSRLLFATADRKAAEPILFLPLAEHAQAVPVKVAEVRITDDKLTLLVEPLSADERLVLLDRIRASDSQGAAASP